MSNPAVQYGAAGRYRSVRPRGVRFKNLSKDIQIIVSATPILRPRPLRPLSAISAAIVRPLFGIGFVHPIMENDK